MKTQRRKHKWISGLIRKGDFETAEHALAEALNSDPDDPELFYLRGMLYGSQFRFHEAVQAFKRTLAISSDHAAALFETGMIEMMLCRFNRASELFERAKRKKYRLAETNSYLREIQRVKKVSDARLSVCIIVKNEEKMLPGCLRSVQAIADEIIVVDTGSDDQTVDIARSFGARVFDFEWKKDFSAAKNYCNEQATGDWILQLDADEEVFPEDQNKIREIVHQNRYEGAFVALHNRVSNSFGEVDPSIHYLVRLYRNSREIYYKNPVHEELVISGEVVPVDVNILHHGYNLDPGYLKEKRRRNAEILYSKLQKNPENVSTLFYLSMMHIGNREFNQAEKFARLALDKIPAAESGKSHLKLMLMSNLAMIEVDRSNFEAVREIAEESIRLNAEYLDAYYYLGLALFNSDDLEGARKPFENFVAKSIERRQQPVFALYADGSGTLLHQAYHFLGKIYRKKTDFRKSLEYYSKAVKLNPQFWVCLLDIGYLYMDMQDLHKAAHFLDQGIQVAKKQKDVNKANAAAWFDFSNAVKNYFNVLKILRSNSTTTVSG
jgi:glycosyltransferase involved in cell wall biosynthesis